MHTPTFTHAGGIVLRFPDPSEPLILVVRPSRWVPDGSLPEKAGE